MQNIQLSEALVSRFDLFFVMVSENRIGFYLCQLKYVHMLNPLI
jgi:hypothetical protein